ncbi:MAG: UDP-GlcNAc--UDP-phosphate GlcNAc-1-phosphate transferase [Bacteroidales bacterium]|nr:UDP-GlcNAc--UDP-phosphate GlcNAc-1-phosphate transferase [Bacteroidales bacterium]
MIKYLVIAVLLFAIELVYFFLADKFNIIDKPNLRSSHTHITLRGGGIIFLFGAALFAAFYGLQYPWFLLGLLLIGGISFWDNVHSLPDSVRLVVQFVSMMLMFQDLGILQWNMWWAVILGLILCVGIINAYNFMDGINGITGGYSVAVLLPLIVLNTSSEEAGFIDNNLLVVVLLSVLVFCFFNFRMKAKCFAGDVGSVSMAFILVFAIGLLVVKTGDFSYIMLLAVYGVDAVLTIMHRIMLHENLGQAHRKHAYQLMANELKMPHVLVSSIYAVLQLVISAGLVYLPMNHYLYSVIVLVLLSAGYLVFMKKYYPLHEAYLRSLEQK